MNYRCPVCGYSALPYPPENYHICPCCGTEFGNDDTEHTHAELRRIWVDVGARWFFGNPPPNWNPWLQLIDAKFYDAVPFVPLAKPPSGHTGRVVYFSDEPMVLTA